MVLDGPALAAAGPRSARTHKGARLEVEPRTRLLQSWRKTLEVLGCVSASKFAQLACQVGMPAQ